ncbi:MAG TPA: Ig domain-containing protein [Candidatus Saccharimonadales bacterium]|nr:Ig domain-containing protein [Candidatus Saccharimonadales bacterium]
MLKLIKRFWWLALLAFGLQAVCGFTPIGPGIGGGKLGDAWETPVIDYGLGTDVGTPKNIGEEYRRNTAVMYYGYNVNFLDYFGTNGMAAVDGAFTIMNNLSNVDAYSSSLSEFPLDSQDYNLTAQALELTDLKSFTLNLLMEQMGLAQPERYTWTLRTRIDPPGCPLTTTYVVTMRNFDTTTLPSEAIQYSPYVNGTLYTYEIFEFCGGPDPLAGTINYNADHLANIYTSVASFYLDPGFFYTGLTRDDVAGLRYLYQTNNINYESPTPGSDILTTNLGGEFVLSNLDLSVLSASALTNDPVTLATLFPNLIITGVTTNFTEVCTPNIVFVLQNLYGAPAGSPPEYVAVTNGYNCSYQPVYTYGFGNVITNTFSKNTHAHLVTISIGTQTGAPLGSPLVTNTVSQSMTLTNAASGDYFIIPPGDCGLDIVPGSGIVSGVTTTTNVITTATNSAGFVSSVSLITTFTNRQYLAYPVICGANPSTPGLYEGIEHVQFVKADYDSLIGQYFQPITNDYTMTYVDQTNGQIAIQHFQRVVTGPDILFSAVDYGDATIGTRNLNFDQGNVPAGLAGPGVINPPTTITFNKVGPIYFNGPLELYLTNGFLGLGELTQTPGYPSLGLLTWASFDASTNPPVIYPDGTSIQNFENEVLIQISPTSLPDGTNNVPYPATTFTTTGGGAFTPPFTWAVLNSTPLPTGLTLSPDGTISGTPINNAPGTYDFVVQMSDSLTPPRTVQWNYSITIH